MERYELTKSIEAKKLNKRTMIPVAEPPVMIPFGAIITHLEPDRDQERFQYLGEPYSAPSVELRRAIKPA